MQNLSQQFGLQSQTSPFQKNRFQKMPDKNPWRPRCDGIAKQFEQRALELAQFGGVHDCSPSFPGGHNTAARYASRILFSVISLLWFGVTVLVPKNDVGAVVYFPFFCAAKITQNKSVLDPDKSVRAQGNCGKLSFLWPAGQPWTLCVDSRWVSKAKAEKWRAAADSV